MKRHSFVAPLLLIGIGLLFLLRNLYPDLPLVDYLARYWPFLLIAWGFIRLVEILIWAANSQPLPAYGMSGGEWILVVFLCMFGASVHAARGFTAWWPHANVGMGGLDMFGEGFEFPISGEKASSKAPRVVIESFRGNVRIQGADVDQVKVTGHKTIRSFNQGTADRADRDAPFELAGDADRVVVRTNQDRVSGNLRVSEEMEITVPKGSSIEGHGRTGDFDITSVGGNVEIVSDNAGVRLQDIGGDARIDLRRSDIVRAVNVKGLIDVKGGRGSDLDLQTIGGPVTIAGSYSGVIQFQELSQSLRMNGSMGLDLSIEKLPGRVRLALGDVTGSHLVGPVRLTSRSRDIRISDFTNSLDVSLDRGDIELRPGQLPLSRIDARTHSGNVVLALPVAAKFDLDASTGRGDVTNNFGSPLTSDTSGRGATLRGVVNGGPKIVVHTDRGEVTVLKAMPGDDKAPAASSRDTTLLKKLDQ